MFESPNLKGKFPGNEYFIALLSATLWAVNPIQTQAVTYVVQRMASMAAMFYILGIYFYVKGRLHESRPFQIVFYLTCLLSFVCALASKENSATLPVAIILLEITFFQDLSQSRTRKRVFWTTMGTGLGIVLFGSLFYLHGDPLSFLKSYNERFFSPLQRLMTEPRILIFYLTLIFYPAPTRLSIEHDVAVSTSLIHPWSTIPSIIIIFFLIGLGFSQMRKRPVLSFAILFFFLNHLIESTVIGLELTFEHRNYLPSLFLFLPISVAFQKLLDHYRQRKSAMHVVLVSFLILIIVGLGTGTYIRNLTWATEKSLWEDAMRKAPKMFRPYLNLAWGYYQRTGQYDKALTLYAKAASLKMHKNRGNSLALNNMASIYYLKGDLNKAAELWTEVVLLSPHHGFYQYRLAKVLEELGQLEKAIEPLDKFISRRPQHIDS
jgi:tetratricopeptide (TPR) repeat protein